MSNQTKIEAAIEILGLSKTFGKDDKKVHALSDINLTINKGEIFALLGPNGAGKTTLIQTITSLAHPTKGTAKVFGHDVKTESLKTRELIGLVPQEINFDSFFSVYDSIRFQQGFYNKPYDHEKIKTLLNKLELWDKRDAKGNELSGGMKRRVMIAKALIHEPPIVFLDEPTAGVDVELRENLWANIRELHNNGTTIILTTHYIEEAEQLANRIGIINKGHIIKVDEKTKLMNELGDNQLIIHTSGKENTPLSIKGAQITDNKITLHLDSLDTPLHDVIINITTSGRKITSINEKTRSLQDIFVDIINHKEKGASS